jgi:hypothetical protein
MLYGNYQIAYFLMIFYKVHLLFRIRIHNTALCDSLLFYWFTIQFARSHCLSYAVGPWDITMFYAARPPRKKEYKNRSEGLN